MGSHGNGFQWISSYQENIAWQMFFLHLQVVFLLASKTTFQSVAMVAKTTGFAVFTQHRTSQEYNIFRLEIIHKQFIKPTLHSKTLPIIPYFHKGFSAHLGVDAEKELAVGVQTSFLTSQAHGGHRSTKRLPRICLMFFETSNQNFELSKRSLEKNKHKSPKGSKRTLRKAQSKNTIP